MMYNILIINAINDDGKRTTYKICEDNSRYIVIQYNTIVLTTEDELSARNAIECMMKDNGWHLEELVSADDANDWSTAITFDPVDSETVIIKVYEWMGGRYVQIGPEDRYSAKLAAEEYGYC